MLRTKTVSALKWTVGAQLLSTLIKAGTLLGLTRLVAPDAFGIYAIAFAAVAFLRLGFDLGLKSAIIQTPNLNRSLLPGITGFVCLVALALIVFMQFIAGPTSAILNMSQLEMALRLLCFTLVFEAAIFLPSARLTRSLRMDLVILADFTATVILSVVALVLAWLGYGLWALVISQVAFVAARFVMLCILAPSLFTLPSVQFSSAFKFLRFGYMVTASDILNYFNRKADVFVVGLLSGASATGNYSLAMDLAKTPTRTILPAFNRVLFPAFSRTSKNLSNVSKQFLRLSEVLSLIIFPAFFGISVIAEDLVLVLFGPNWEKAGLTISIVAFALPFRVLSRALSPALRAIGREDRNLQNILVTVVAMTLGLLLGSSQGYVGLCVGWTVGIILAALVNLLRSLPVLDVSKSEYFFKLVFFAAAAFTMAFALDATSFSLYSLSPTLRIAIQVVSGMALYSVAMLILKRELLLWLLNARNRR